ncbi:MAG TPA: hypothetical protein VKW08_17250 [Xanthobacteraceae bacterium]|jgi:hypothetical protein|nr:hypothetical protein [Xanthobacteraceae bacterium]
MRAKGFGGMAKVNARIFSALIAPALIAPVLMGVLALVLLPARDAQAQFWWFNGPQRLVWHGNDTGGIIPWSCENEAAAQAAAAAYCAQWHKYSRITGVNRQYGDFISFNCLWAPNIGRFDLPAVATRNVCAAEPRRLLTK